MGSILDGLDELGGGLRPTQIPDGVGAFELGQMVYRGEVVLTPQQVSMLKEMLQYEAPKLQAIAVGRLQGEDFATRLERAIMRSAGSKATAAPSFITDQRPTADQRGDT